MNLQELIDMSYAQLVQHLLDKYGPAKHDYFNTPECKSKSTKLSRTKEGLFCHHIAENKEILLSTPEVARMHPFEYQQKHNLVYANYIEHLLLHIKIVQEDEESRGVGLGGVIMISSILNDYYRHRKADGWKRFATDVIKDNYEDYITIMKHFQAFVDDNPNLAFLLPPPVLAQGWYGRINRKVHKEIYDCYPEAAIPWSNSDVLKYLENEHK